MLIIRLYVLVIVAFVYFFLTNSSVYKILQLSYIMIFIVIFPEGNLLTFPHFWVSNFPFLYIFRGVIYLLLFLSDYQ